MTTTLIDPETIPLTNADFRKWMDQAGVELERLDARHYDVLTNYFLSLNDSERDQQMHILKWDLIGLKIAMKATWALWKQLRAEMD